MMNTIRKLSTKIFDWSLFVCDLDPFELFKDEKTRARLQFKLGQSSEFHLNHDQQDAKRAKLARYNRMFACYFIVKMSLISIVQYYLLEHQFRHQLDSEPTVELRHLLKISSLIGNPVGILIGSALYIYLGLGIVTFVGLVVVPQYYKRIKKLDMSYLRFILQPKLERSRVKSTMRLKLNELIVIVGANLNYPLNFEPASSYKSRLKIIIKRIEMRNDCLELFNGLHQVHARIIPEAYSAEWYEHLSKQRDIFVVSILFGISVISLPIWTLIGQLMYESNLCAMNYQESRGKEAGHEHFSLNCQLVTLSDVICIIEMLYSVALIACIEIFNYFTVAIQYESHMKLIETMDEHLDECNKQLGKQIKLLIRASHELHISHHHRQKYFSNFKPDKLVLDQLARLLLFEVELKDGLRSLTELTNMSGYHVFSIVVLNLITEKFQIDLSKQLRNTFILMIWFGFNVIGFICSNCYVKHTRLHKYYWSIAARLTELEYLLAGNNDNDDDDDDDGDDEPLQLGCREDCHISSSIDAHLGGVYGCLLDHHEAGSSLLLIKRIWARFIIASSTNIRSCVMSPLGIDMMFERVIELNFVALLVLTLSSSGSFLNGPRR